MSYDYFPGLGVVEYQDNPQTGMPMAIEHVFQSTSGSEPPSLTIYDQPFVMDRPVVATPQPVIATPKPVSTLGAGVGAGSGINTWLPFPTLPAPTPVTAGVPNTLTSIGGAIGGLFGIPNTLPQSNGNSVSMDNLLLPLMLMGGIGGGIGGRLVKPMVTNMMLGDPWPDFKSMASMLPGLGRIIYPIDIFTRMMNGSLPMMNGLMAYMVQQGKMGGNNMLLPLMLMGGMGGNSSSNGISTAAVPWGAVAGAASAIIPALLMSTMGKKKTYRRRGYRRNYRRSYRSYRRRR